MSRYGRSDEPDGPGDRPAGAGSPADPWQEQAPVWAPGSADPSHGPAATGWSDGDWSGSDWSGGDWSGGGWYPVDDPAAPPPGGGRSASGPRPLALYALVTVLVLLAATGVAYGLFLLTRDGGGAVAGGAGTPAPTGGAGTPRSTADPTATPGDNIGMSAAMARVDDCLVNDGSLEQPQLRIVPCDTAGDGSRPAFRVLAVFDEQVDGEGAEANEQAQEICADTEGYTHHYYELRENSFVLCMAEVGDDGPGVVDTLGRSSDF